MKAVDLGKLAAADVLAVGLAALAPARVVAKPVGGAGTGALFAGDEQERDGAARAHLHLAFAGVSRAHCSEVVTVQATHTNSSQTCSTCK